jgi:membrane-associated phospholipid phosphatase
MSEVMAPKAVARRRSSNLRLGTIALVLGRITALVCALLLLWIAATRDFDPLAVSQYVGMAAILLVGGFTRQNSATLLILTYVFSFLVFVQLRTIADETAIPTRYHYAILVERGLFAGILPSAWLQQAFYVSGRIGIIDYVLSATYISYFAAPHLAAVLVWRTRPRLLPRALTALTLTFMIGLLFYFLIPTAPPWLASESGVIPEQVLRVLPELSAQVAGDTYDEASRAVGQNDVAAMPSLHTALTTMVALILASYGRRWRWVGITYVALMGTALVYLGEHYVIDEIAGIALAVGVWKLVTHHRMFAWVTPSADQDEESLRVGAESRAA